MVAKAVSYYQHYDHFDIGVIDIHDIDIHDIDIRAIDIRAIDITIVRHLNASYIKKKFLGFSFGDI